MEGQSNLTAGGGLAAKPAYRTVKIDGLDIFYREAGPKDAPVVLLLHGFPTSSHMFRNLIPALADEFHLVAPDYPGFGNSSMPTVDQFEYTFDNLADVIEKFTEKIGLKKYTLYVQDYGAPVGYRLAAKHPERVQALVVQNGNAYDEGLDNDFWKPLKAYWKEKTAEREEPLRGFLTREATIWQYTTASGTRRRSAPTTGTSTSRCSTGRGTPRSSSLFSTATAATRRCTRSGRPTSASTSRRPSSSGERTIRSSPQPAPSRTRET